MSPELKPELGDAPLTARVRAGAINHVKLRTHLDIEMVDEEDQPMVSERYLVDFADGSKREGHLNPEGKARIWCTSDEPCRISFPDLDGPAWERLESA